MFPSTVFILCLYTSYVIGYDFTFTQKWDLDVTEIHTQYGNLGGMIRYVVCKHHLVDTEGKNDRDLKWDSLPGGDRKPESQWTQHWEDYTGQYHVQDVVRRTTLEGQTHHYCWICNTLHCHQLLVHRIGGDSELSVFDVVMTKKQRHINNYAMLHVWFIRFRQHALTGYLYNTDSHIRHYISFIFQVENNVYRYSCCAHLSVNNTFGGETGE